MLSPAITSSGVSLRWNSVTNRSYFVERAINLGPPASFSPLQINIPGLSVTTSFTDTNPPNSIPVFYRVGIN
jgi:hypothetical protein